MDVHDAVRRRRSVRAFLDTPVDDATVAELLELAARAPSGGNVQPWRIYVITAATMPRFVEFIGAREMEPPAYDIYPPSLWEPYRTNRFAIGEAMYRALGIPRADLDARLEQLARNWRFFDAPVGIFCFIDRRMGPPQWSDLGMFLQTFMLLATERGLDTCAQEAWAMWSGAVSEFVDAPEEEMLFCGVALGHADPEAPVNHTESERMPLAEWARFL